MLWDTLTKDSVLDLASLRLNKPTSAARKYEAELLHDTYKDESKEYEDDYEMVVDDAGGPNPQQAPTQSKPILSSRPNDDDYEYFPPRCPADVEESQEITEGGRKKNNVVRPHPCKEGKRCTRSTTVAANGNDGAGSSTNPQLVTSAPWYVNSQKRPTMPSLFCCMFPWLANISPSPEGLDSARNEHPMGTSEPGQKGTSFGGSFDEYYHDDDGCASSTTSTSSNELGEKLSERELQALLARLRLLVQPEVDSDSSFVATEAVVKVSDGCYETPSKYQLRCYKDGLLNGIPILDVSPLTERRRGILKNTLLTDKVDSEHHNRDTTNSKFTQSKSRGGVQSSRLPSESFRELRSVGVKSIRFASMSRVVRITSRKEMSDEEKADIWWQRKDYECFRRTGRIISCGTVENADGYHAVKGSSSRREDDRIPSDYGERKDSTPERKWWHKYGHSRRGLEHVVSIDEGRQRQLNVKAAIRAVLDEQSRQVLFRKCSGIDDDAGTIGCPEERLREISLHNTQWARDLALALGASDADAVRRGLSGNHLSRDFYLHKLAGSESPGKASPSRKNRTSSPTDNTSQLHGGITKKADHFVPQFMKPLSSSCESLLNLMIIGVESSEPVYDPDVSLVLMEFEQNRTQSWSARKAASYSAVDGVTKVNFAAVLSGMDS